MTPHAVVLMPNGKHITFEQKIIEFEQVYQTLVKPALTKAGLKIIRADLSPFPGDLPPQLLQELLSADVVLADLTEADANIGYALGVRQALRSGGVILISADDSPLCQNHLTPRAFNYGLNARYLEPETLQILNEWVETAKKSWHSKPTSPIFKQLIKLAEPDWRQVRVSNALDFWDAQSARESRLHLAEIQGHLGDLLTLAEESSVAQFRAEAFIKVAGLLRKAGQVHIALNTLEKALAILPNHLPALCEKGICLNALSLQGAGGIPQYAARLHYIEVLKEFPDASEVWRLLGEIDKDAWVKIWFKPGFTSAQMRSTAAEAESRLRSAIESYRQAFRRNAGCYIAGMQALTLIQVYQTLTGENRFFAEAKLLAGAVSYAAEFDLNPSFSRYATLAELEVLNGTPATVRSAYKAAIHHAEQDGMAIQLVLGHLQQLKHLNFQLDQVKAGISVLEGALAQNPAETEASKPRQVILFSGHLPDLPERATPRFSATKIDSAAVKIAQAIKVLTANSKDLALTQGAAGGDVLFAEACGSCGVNVQLLQPFPEAEFIQRSISDFDTDGQWLARYQALISNLAHTPRNLVDGLGSIDESGANPYERCNRWLLNTALSYGLEKVRLICLWDGEHSSGTAHMVHIASEYALPVTWIHVADL